MASTIDNKEHDKKEVDGVDSEKEMHQINNECIKNKDIAKEKLLFRKISYRV